MREHQMPQSLRFTKEEEKELYEKCRDLNKKLVMADKPTIRESELAHFIFQETVKNVKIDKNGDIYIDM